MEGVKCFLIVTIIVCVLTSEALSGKLMKKRSSGNGESGSDLSSETLLLRDKLNLILDAESREVTLLKSLLDEDHEHEVERNAKKASTTSTTTTTTTERTMEREVKREGGDDTNDDVYSKKNDNGGLEYLREQGIVTKLEENSKRMEKMVVFLVDLRNLLTEALTQHNRQMAVESEMVEIREEMEYLRKELKSVKNEQHKQSYSSLTSSNGHYEGNHDSSSPSTSSLANQLHNEHVTLEWMKTSTHELRTQIRELSDQCNATVVMSLREKMDKETSVRDENLAQAEKQLDTLRLGQLRQQEEINEAKGNIEDLRSWQVKMGNKIVGRVATAAEDNSEAEEKSNSIEEEHFITEAMKEAVGKPNLRHHQSHKRLKSKIFQLQQIIDDLSESNRNHERRLSKMETSQRTLKSLIASTNSGGRRQQRSLTDSSSSQKSLQSLEKTMQEYVLTLESLNDKVSGMDELQESTTQLFQSLEQLEKKYDDRVAEIQTGLARVESGMSGALVTTEDLKEQQSQQSSVIQSVKKDIFQMKGKLQTNHLRLAGIQSEMVRWASHKCSAENKESIQNIRIATLEHALLQQKNEEDHNINEDENTR